MSTIDRTDVVVIGGGLGGLTAAAYLARSGASVTVCEKARGLGGRAATHQEHGFLWNLGPHALYAGSEGIRALRELEVPFRGHKPSATGAYGVYRGRKHALPGGPVSLLITGLLGVKGKLEIARLLGSLPKLEVAKATGQSVAEWLLANVRDEVARALVQALFRVSTYANAPKLQDAGTALHQLQLALSDGVLYLDGGWQTLVDGLRERAVSAGASLVTGARVAELEHRHGIVEAVRLADGRRIVTDAVVIAGSPGDAAALLPQSERAQAWAKQLIPVKAACLDLALRRLPQPRATFALGIDQPLYLSVHSAVAGLAPEGNATVHVAKYLPCGADSEAKSDRAELEALMDTVQPGWRGELVADRFLPSMVVTHALVTADMNGYRGRPAAELDDLSGVYLAGDWVGSQGMLADATIASGRAVAQQIALRRRQVAAAA
ncbi:MAG TPA: NAD(P)/FAD-dependent oxidoreductase [Terriglobales bacterium]|nr:NAD(P)/FAD-dependent oxidoreductase [Terriglobales bacterium]